jgi:hypothetical protein
MITDPDALIVEFSQAAVKAGIEGWPCPVRPQALPAPHRKPPLPAGEAAVYAFAFSAHCTAPCGPATVLKVGKAGAGNQKRFRYMHYRLPSKGMSTLAGSLLAHPILWPWLGISHLDAATVGEWMLARLDRIHFFIPSGHPYVLGALEVYVRARTGSVFEGAGSGKGTSS